MQKKMLTGELVTRENRYSFMKHIGILPNPDKVLAVGGRNYETLRDLKNDPHVWSCIQSRKSGTLSLDWAIDGEQPLSQELSEMLSNIDVYTFISDILEAVLFGYQPFEIIWDFSGSKHLSFVPKSITPKPQEWFFYDGNGNLRYRNANNIDGIIAPEAKIFVFGTTPLT